MPRYVLTVSFFLATFPWMTKVDRADAKETGSWAICDAFDEVAWRPEEYAAADRSISLQRVGNATSLESFSHQIFV